LLSGFLFRFVVDISQKKNGAEQNPYVGGGPVIGKVLIVCPVTLVNVRMSLFPLSLCTFLTNKKELESRVPQMVSDLGRVSII
jgi:hypothetical protein